MRRLLFVLLFFSALPVAALAAPLRIDITYSEGKIISGPLTPDLDVLPELVFASFTLNDAGGTLDNILASSLVFGDAEWSAGDLESFTATFLPTDSGALAVTALSYSYRAKNTPTTNGKLAANFPLVIQGTDIASGEPFQYQYDTSTQTVTEIPEPSSVVLAALGILGLLATARRRFPIVHDAGKCDLTGGNSTRHIRSSHLEHRRSILAHPIALVHRTIAVFLVAVFAALSAPQLMAAVIPPIGLAPGSQYQLVFSTAGTISGTSATETTYNSFVTAEAALNPLLPVTSWRAVTSTADGSNASPMRPGSASPSITPTAPL
jgi:hypothetical protein